jgi:hypothetical protein
MTNELTKQQRDEIRHFCHTKYFSLTGPKEVIALLDMLDARDEQIEKLIKIGEKQQDTLLHMASECQFLDTYVKRKDGIINSILAEPTYFTGEGGMYECCKSCNRHEQVNGKINHALNCWIGEALKKKGAIS